MKLKFCGFRTATDVKQARHLDIDAIGFIHYPKSKRFVDTATIKSLIQLVPNDKQTVVIVVNPTMDKITELVQVTGLSMIQLHGDESVEFVAQVKQHFPQLNIIKALPANEKLNANLVAYQPYVNLFIIDTPSKAYGGTGQHFNWQILQQIRDIPYLIAGGINYDSIQQIEQLNLAHSGYDIASGIEINQYKDKDKMNDIIKLVKGVSTHE